MPPDSIAQNEHEKHAGKIQLEARASEEDLGSEGQEQTVPDSGRKRIDSITIEFNSKHQGIGFAKGAPYVATTGPFKPARDIQMPLSQVDCLIELQKLRYKSSEAETRDARHRLGGNVRRILAVDPKDHKGPTQLDLVSNAQELWAVPFEACLAPDGQPLFVGREPAVILTRRIRQEFADHQYPWPTKPRVLFITVSPGEDMEEELIEENRKALLDALNPWIEPLDDAEDKEAIDKVLTTLEDPWLDEIESTCAEAWEDENPFTHIHILAHGTEIPDRRLPGSFWWGLDLRNQEEIGPQELKDAVAPRNGYPAVMTIAACDSANHAISLTPGKSLAQEMHCGGVPVVVASQLPIRKESALALTRSFYPTLLSGSDIRHALHEARSALYENDECGHDWLSMVAYVQLPVGYAGRLLETALQAELGMLETASRWAGVLEGTDQPDHKKIQRTERALRQRIGSLRRRHKRMESVKLDAETHQEIHGLLASAHKRLAQFLFARGEIKASLEMLRESRSHYNTAFRMNFDNHWTGVQWLCLEAILAGEIKEAYYWPLFYKKAMSLIEERAAEYWACGTIMELCLLAPLADFEQRLEEGARMLELLIRRTPERFPIDATRRQLRRYTTWWTKENGFFENRDDDLKKDAEHLLATLDQATALADRSQADDR